MCYPNNYAWVEPLKRKSATELDAAWERLWKRLGTGAPNEDIVQNHLT